MRADRRRRAAGGLALLAVARREQDAELGGDRDHERAQRGGHRVERDAQREQHERRPAGGERDRDQRERGVAHPAAHDQQHEEHRHQPEQQADRPPRGGRQLVVGLRRQHRESHHVGGHARGRVELALDVVDHLLLAVERHQPDAEREARHLVVRRQHALREVGRDLVEEGVDRRSRDARVRGAEEVRQRERRAQLGRVLGLDAGVAVLVTVRRQHPRLELGHPGDHARVGEVLGAHHHVDLARQAGGLLQVVHVPQRGHVLGHELAHVGDHLGLRVRRPAEHREQQTHQRAPCAAARWPCPPRRWRRGRRGPTTGRRRPAQPCRAACPPAAGTARRPAA